MTHWKQLLDPSVFLGPQDFQADKTVAISRVVREELPERKGDAKTSAPMMYFAHGGKELPRKYKVPKSVMYGLSLYLGTDSDAWAGKECVRIRFPAEIDKKIRMWLKKRKASPSAYIMQEGQ
jgi:hypothetical protein